MSMHTLYRWCRQALIDMGLLEGVKEFAQIAPFVEIILKCRRACNAGHSGRVHSTRYCATSSAGRTRGLLGQGFFEALLYSIGKRRLGLNAVTD
jgi:hypothetical protein